MILVRITISLLCILLALSSSQALADPTELPPQLPADRILQQLQLEQRERKLEQQPVIIEEDKIKPAPIKKDDRCVEIKDVKLEGVTIFSKRTQQQWLKNIFGQCVSFDQINQLLKDITDAYLKDNYSTTRAYFVNYDYQSKVMTLKIEEGKINSLILRSKKLPAKDDQTATPVKPDPIAKDSSQNSLSDQSQIFFAFPASKGEALNVKDLAQGIQQMNRLQSNKSTTLDIEPASVEGQSEVIITRYRNGILNGMLRPSISYDNYGSKATGRNNTTYSLTSENLLSINDSFTFSKILSDRSNTGFTSFSIPLGYYTFTYNRMRNHYFAYTDNDVKITGNSSSDDFGLNRLLFRDQKNQLDLTTNLNLRNQARATAGDPDFTSQRLSIARIGLNYRLQMGNAALLLGAQASKGLAILNAIQDDKSEYPLRKDSPRAQFEKYSYNLGFYYNMANLLQYNLSGQLQYSPDALYGPELIYVGGNESTVRGLQYSGLVGSKGGYLRNEITLNLATAVASLNSSSLTSAKAKFISLTKYVATGLRPYLFYDTGFTKAVTDFAQDSKSQFLAGRGVGLRYSDYFNVKYTDSLFVNGDVSYAKSMRANQTLLAQNSYHNSAVYLRLTAGIAF